MKHRLAHALRRLANRLDHADEVTVRLKVTYYNGPSVDTDKVIATALRNHNRRHGLGGLA
jgi:hypothetical protein